MCHWCQLKDNRLKTKILILSRGSDDIPLAWHVSAKYSNKYNVESR